MNIKTILGMFLGLLVFAALLVYVMPVKGAVGNNEVRCNIAAQNAPRIADYRNRGAEMMQVLAVEYAAISLLDAIKEPMPGTALQMMKTVESLVNYVWVHPEIPKDKISAFYLPFCRRVAV